MIKHNDQNYARVNKTKTRKHWEEGLSITFVCCNFVPFGVFGTFTTSKAERESKPDNTTADFDSTVSDFEFYNCVDTETGRRAAYYVVIS